MASFLAFAASASSLYLSMPKNKKMFRDNKHLALHSRLVRVGTAAWIFSHLSGSFGP